MTLTDLIDEALRNLGATEDAIDQARWQSIAMNIRTLEQKDRISRELTPKEVEGYRATLMVIFSILLNDPDLMKRLTAEHKQDIENN